MRMQKIWLTATALVLSAGALAATDLQIEREISGFEPEGPIGVRPGTTPRVPTPSPVLGMLPTTGLLLIPESTNDRVMAFDPMTGNLLDADFIAADPDNLSTPIHAILGPDGASILVSDQIDDVVQQYALDGTYLGIFAPAGGVDTTILDNVRGISLDPANGNLLVSVGGGANDDAIAEFDTAGNSLGNRVANGAGGLDSPFDVLFFGNEIFSGGITSDAIHTYALNGTYIDDFSPINTFPEQLAPSASGGLLVANFSGTEEGVVEYDAAGNQIGIYNPASLGGYRGVYELPNGNILTTNGGGVHEIDRSGNLVETKITGVSARFIEFVTSGVVLPPPAEVPTLNTTAMALMILSLFAAALFFRRRLNH
ncbi:MAG: hypothetical protein Tsb002_35120 [Wenzhouxiangellaceae bacterium]